MKRSDQLFYCPAHLLTVSAGISIETLAGNDIEKAKYYEEDKDYLLEFEPSVMHCESYDFRYFIPVTLYSC